MAWQGAPCCHRGQGAALTAGCPALSPDRVTSSAGANALALPASSLGALQTR